jgi:NAD(P)-dependent dehydrogenase (short-subunit alcohol dehydrogenase family)
MTSFLHASVIALAARTDMSRTIQLMEKAAQVASITMPKVIVINLDVTNQRSVESGAAKFNNECPDGLDILVSNAGYLEQPEAFLADRMVEEH